MDLFKKNNINNTKTLFQFSKNNIMFKWVDKNDNIYNPPNDKYNYTLQSPERFMKNKVGICRDQTEFHRLYFETQNIKYKTFYIFLNNPSKGCPSHTALIFFKNNYIYRFEPGYNHSKVNYSGIHKYKSEKEMLLDLKNCFIVNSLGEDYDNKNENIYCYEYKKPIYGINGIEFHNHCKNSKRIPL